MPKLLLIDGSSLAFRAFYGLNQLDKFKTKKGFHTNALYAFHTMLDAMLKRECAEYVLVAFDAGKTTFRTELFAEYKGGRAKMPEELAEQWPYFPVMLDALGIKHYELANYEADDIIGTLAKQAETEDIDVVILSGDKDMIQLVSSHVRVDITQKGNEVKSYTIESIQEDMHITPRQIIDVKGLMGDSSDNYPGVTKVGEKTALKLIQEFGSIEGVYEHIDMQKGKLKENLVNDKEMAFLSKTLATINQDAPIALNVKDTLYQGKQMEQLKEFYVQMEFNQFLKQIDVSQEKEIVLEQYHYVDTITSEMLGKESVLHVELLEENYHTGTPLAIAWTNQQHIYVTNWESAYHSSVLKEWLENEQVAKIVYDSKRIKVMLSRYGIDIKGIMFDVLLASYIINVNNHYTDLSMLVTEYGVSNVQSDETVYGKGAKLSIPEQKVIAQHIAQKVRALSNITPILKEKLTSQCLDELYYDMELPLADVLGNMEIVGVHVKEDTLQNMGVELAERIHVLEKEIHHLAGEAFNISSPKQLGSILFEKLGLPKGKKTKTGYSTAVEVLEKLIDVPIVEKILDYRQLTKLNSTYVEGLSKFIATDQKIHTRYVQTLTQTGRLSSTDPNLQNIPIRMEEGRRIRQAFVPSQEDWLMLSADYSQIELRVLAHISQDEHMKLAFVQQEDIHTSTAMRVFGVSKQEVNSDMRRQAKAVNFGIVYGISDYGLSQNLNISRKEAQQFIDTYFDKYPNIKQYMENIVNHAKSQGYVETLFNRRRYLPDLTSSNFNIRSFAERTAMNTPIQGSAADIIKIAMVKMSKLLKEKGLSSRMLLQVHDELIFEVPPHEVDIMKELVSSVMENAVSLSVPLKVDCQIGKTLEL
ncbi:MULTISPECIES: DNA polymerase I [unclassified Granulicatella]|uniref:DNA polymerase I n=1 Tax=unclassified Granulicatella TaxID=2630493 RepID=UPI0010735A84|nr:MULTISPECIES: DNA polymerase I [unclassified Granulicatella]MBF0779849.1 DNA polymerase I [Granulicatella sp. 19428wC4_WM01]TFU96149.1 DNA polymerase I [Granulicatella sp. WM01]